MTPTALPTAAAHMPPTTLPAPLAAVTPRASAFIVTLYGDVVEPRGGQLWMGTLIACCADHGISESLVRTAVSRLVNAGRLEGQRIGRRSHYRLAASARTEFDAASRVLYTPPPEPSGWLIRPGGACPGPDWAAHDGIWIAPNRSDVPVGPALTFSAEAIAGVADLPAFAAGMWPIAEVAQAYQTFLTAFCPVATGTALATFSGATALALRLRLVHEYRLAALSDPRLPRAALPADWPGTAARRLFVSLYLALTDSADAHIERSFRDPGGLLPRTTDVTAMRIDRLRREASR